MSYMIRSFIILIIALSVIYSCKDSATPAASVAIAESNGGNKIHTSPASLSPEKKAQIDDLRSHAHALIEKRSKEEDAYSMLVVGHWVYEAIFAGGERPKPVEPGFWVKYDEDFSYQYGQYDRIDGGGKYHLTFNTEEPTMIMVDDNANKSPEEWKLMTKEDVMILVGSNYFGNNPKQMKLVKEMQRPLANG